MINNNIKSRFNKVSDKGTKDDLQVFAYWQDEILDIWLKNHEYDIRDPTSWEVPRR